MRVERSASCSSVIPTRTTPMHNLSATQYAHMAFQLHRRKAISYEQIQKERSNNDEKDMAFIEKSRDRDAAGPDLRSRPAPHYRAGGRGRLHQVRAVRHERRFLSVRQPWQMHNAPDVLRRGRKDLRGLLRDEGRRHGHLPDWPDLGRSEARHRSHRQNDDGLLLRPLSRHLHGQGPRPGRG